VSKEGILFSLHGSLLNSLLGSTLEARGYMNTHMVNFAATLAAGLLVLMLI